MAKGPRLFFEGKALLHRIVRCWQWSWRIEGVVNMPPHGVSSVVTLPVDASQSAPEAVRTPPFCYTGLRLFDD